MAHDPHERLGFVGGYEYEERRRKFYEKMEPHPGRWHNWMTLDECIEQLFHEVVKRTTGLDVSSGKAKEENHGR